MDFPTDTRRLENPTAKPRIRIAERILLLVGILLTFAYVSVRLDSFVGNRIALTQFEAAKTNIGQIASPGSAGSKKELAVDFSQWSEKRINAYEQSLATYSNMPTALLHIPTLRLRVPVFDGTDDLTLNRGVGRIMGTTRQRERTGSLVPEKAKGNNTHPDTAF